MPIAKDIFQTLRIVPAHFERVAPGNPDPLFPDLDDRGYAAPEHGPIVGLMVEPASGDSSNDVYVVLERQDMELGAQLFVTSSDPSVLRIIHPAAGNPLINTKRAAIGIRGIAGGSPAARTAQVQVHLGSVAGPVIAEMTAWVFRPLRVRITPHLVTIAAAGVPGIPSVANIGNIMPLVRAIWKPCGIEMTVQPTQAHNEVFATAGVVSMASWAEINTLVAHNVPNTINVYMVNRIGNGGTLGLGLSRASVQPGGIAAGVNAPAIILADTTAFGSVRDAMWWANDLAHEAGHFFQLWHPDNLQPPDEREDTWSRRMLMHNFNKMRGHNPWPDTMSGGKHFRHRPRLNDVGYGNLRRGCLITMKDLKQIKTDGECSTARNTIASAAGPY
ncbi:MAG TPA: hypothetical protein VFG50_04390 [Rhodothermales bacterium]|nr:hypothetical protein [Rhodothermales bacterium]